MASQSAQGQTALEGVPAREISLSSALGLLLVSGARRRRRWVQIVLYKAFAELRFDAERYYIGYLWWVVEPIIEMAVYYVVFAELLHRFTEDFVAFLLCGLVAWRWFSATLLKGSTAIVTNQALAAQVFVPKVLFPLITIVVNTVRFTIVLVLLMVFLNLRGMSITWWYMVIPPLMVVQLLFVAAATILAAAVVPFLPSLEVVLDTGLKIGVFLSGVFFDVGTLDASWRWWLSLNPMVPLLEAWRNVLMYHRAPQWGVLAIIAAASVPGILAGRAIIRRYEYVYPKLTS
ncbi:MAG TPA: hypothetical protein VN812_06745 [Candidatus Acidoferrales bacterium]|nr:hypothetical protein [Candidatus Acidoferrales bacterium]